MERRGVFLFTGEFGMPHENKDFPLSLVLFISASSFWSI
jgi:hypothetical protein